MRGIGTAAVAIVAVELVFGQWFPPNFGALQVRPNERRYYDVTGLYPGGGVSIFRTDRYGFRGEYGGAPARIDLLLIGNSTTREEYVTEGSTWADALRRRFREAGRPLRIAVAANHGMTTVGLLRRFDDWLASVPGLRPRYVLAYIGSNDPSPEASVKYDRMAPEGRFDRVRAYLKNASVLYAGLQEIRKLLRRWRPTRILDRNRKEYLPDRWAPAAPRPNDELPRDNDVAASLAAYEFRIGRLIQRIRLLGAEPIIANQHFGSYRIVDGMLHGRIDPATGRASADEYRTAALFGAAAMRACRAAGAICIDTVSEFAYDAPADLYDHVHTTPLGDRKLADFLFSRLKDKIAPEG